MSIINLMYFVSPSFNSSLAR